MFPKAFFNLLGLSYVIKGFCFGIRIVDLSLSNLVPTTRGSHILDIRLLVILI